MSKHKGEQVRKHDRAHEQEVRQGGRSMRPITGAHDAGEEYGQRHRTSDRMNDRMAYGRSEGREYDNRTNQEMERYGMRSDDWREMDRYWQNMYGERYPRESHAGKGPRNYKRSDDRIVEDVNEQLTRHPMIDATDIEVTVMDGEVILRGTVDRRETKRMAEDVADRVSGVKDVRNEIKVQERRRDTDRAA